MDCLVFFLALRDTERQTLNRDRWNAHEWSRIYADLQLSFEEPADEDMILRAIELGLYKPAARLMGRSENPEAVWNTLQNGDRSWREQQSIRYLGAFPRSMMTGDLVVFADGTTLFTQGIGFGAVSDRVRQALIALLEDHCDQNT